MLGFIGRLGTTELLVILGIVIIVFGPKSIPQLSKMLGKSVKNFKKGMESTETTDEDDE
ncbi:MAG: twin-arginine translocase TatA/TatE family subunit [Erysipelotrichales bacterium]|nr:twin-arginine translocase TatA/TatE family subunit [Erysipelotrichales bacterium]